MRLFSEWRATGDGGATLKQSRDPTTENLQRQWCVGGVVGEVQIEKSGVDKSKRDKPETETSLSSVSAACHRRTIRS